MVYDRVYTPAGKYCRRAPPLHFLTKIHSGPKTAAHPSGEYIENSGKFRRTWPPILRNFGQTRGLRIDAERFLSGRSAWDKTVPADRSIYGQGRRREGRAREGEPRDGGYNMGYRGGPTPGGEQGPSFYYPGSHRGSQPSLRLPSFYRSTSSRVFLVFPLKDPAKYFARAISNFSTPTSGCFVIESANSTGLFVEPLISRGQRRGKWGWWSCFVIESFVLLEVTFKLFRPSNNETNMYNQADIATPTKTIFPPCLLN